MGLRVNQIHACQWVPSSVIDADFGQVESLFLRPVAVGAPVVLDKGR